MTAILQLVKLFSRKRRAEEEFLSHQYKINDEMARKRFITDMDFKNEASEPLWYVSNHDYKKLQKRARSR